MAKHLTASDLKYKHESHNPESLFFTRDTMKFFGDKMSNYYVSRHLVNVKTYDGKVHECYALQRRKPVNGGLTSTSYFSATDYSRVLGEVL